MGDLTRICATVMAAAAAAGCGGGGNVDNTPPAFRSVNASTISPREAVLVVANEQLSPEGARIEVRDRFQILGGGSTRLLTDGVTLEWRPLTELPCGAVLSVLVNAYDLAGNAGSTSFGGPTVVCPE
jgi:hypothetical protein